MKIHSNWWDTTTTPLPWNTPFKPVTTPVVPWVNPTTGGSFAFPSYPPTQEQKAEVVLAVLLNVLLGKAYVELMSRVIKDTERKVIEFIYMDTGLQIRVPHNMGFTEIVNALYEEFGNLRGKEIR